MMGDFTATEFEQLEEQIPQYARQALKKARQSALARGGQVLEARQGKLLVINAAGAETLLKEVEQPVQLQVGQKFKRI